MKYQLREGGSGAGYSFWSGFYGCPKKLELNRQFEEAGFASPKDEALNIGTLVHALIECWWQGVHPNDVEFEPEPNQEDYIKAFNLIKAYIQRDPDADLFGTPVHLEYRVPVDIVDDLDFNELSNYYKYSASAKKFAEILGFPGPWSGRIDAVTDVDEKQALRLKELYNIDVEPGLWLCDHKTDRGRPVSHHKYVNTIQFMSYIVAWNTFHPERPVKGMIANVVVKTVSPQFYAYVTNVPGPSEIGVLKTFYSTAYHRYTHERGKANPTACMQFKPCMFLDLNLCDRHSDFVYIKKGDKAA